MVKMSTVVLNLRENLRWQRRIGYTSCKTSIRNTLIVQTHAHTQSGWNWLLLRLVALTTIVHLQMLLLLALSLSLSQTIVAMLIKSYIWLFISSASNISLEDEIKHLVLRRNESSNAFWIFYFTNTYWTRWYTTHQPNLSRPCLRFCVCGSIVISNEIYAHTHRDRKTTETKKKLLQKIQTGRVSGMENEDAKKGRDWENGRKKLKLKNLLCANFQHKSRKSQTIENIV